MPPRHSKSACALCRCGTCAGTRAGTCAGRSNLRSVQIKCCDLCGCGSRTYTRRATNCTRYEHKKRHKPAAQTSGASQWHKPAAQGVAQENWPTWEYSLCHCGTCAAGGGGHKKKPWFVEKKSPRRLSNKFLNPGVVTVMESFKRALSSTLTSSGLR